MSTVADLEAIRCLKGVLESMENAGGRLLPDMIGQPEGDSCRNKRSLTYQEDKLKTMRTVVGMLQNAIDQRLDPVGREKASVFDKLPDEMLLEISKEAIDMGSLEQDRVMAIYLSHVSSRFRRIILNVSSAWSHVFSTFPLDMLQAFIERSQPEELRIFLQPPAESENLGSQHYRDVLQLLFSHPGRWGYLMIPENEAFEELCALSPDICLPNLGHIHLHGSDISKWPAIMKTPKLYRISTLGPGVSITTFATTVTSAHVTFYQDTEEWRHDAYLATFMSSPMLNDLFLTYDQRHSPRLFAARITEFSFTTLKKFKMHVIFNPDWALYIARCSFPLLEELDIFIGEDVQNNQVGFLAFTTALSRCNFPKLRTLSIEFDQYEWNEDDDEVPNSVNNGTEGSLTLFGPLVRQMPQLECLTVNASCLKPLAYDFAVHKTGTNPLAELLHLRSISYINCEAVDRRYLQGLTRCLKESRAWAGFKELQVVRRSPTTTQLDKDEIDIAEEKWEDVFEKAGKAWSTTGGYLPLRGN